MTNTPARGPRGDYQPGRGDLTGRKHVTASEEKARRDEAMKRTRNALLDQPPKLSTPTKARTSSPVRHTARSLP
jgi:hypothetical protein